MKKLPNTLGEHISKFTLYLEDIYLIYEKLKSVSENVTIVVNGYKLDNFDELQDERFSNINNMSMSISEPYVSIDLENKRIWLYTDSDNYLNLGIFNDLKTLILKRQNRIRDFSWLRYFTPLPIVIYATYCFYTDKKLSPLFIVVALCYFCLDMYIHIKTSGPKGRVFNYRSKEISNFWIRNKDSIVLGLGSLILGSILTLILQSIFRID